MSWCRCGDRGSLVSPRWWRRRREHPNPVRLVLEARSGGRARFPVCRSKECCAVGRRDERKGSALAVPELPPAAAVVDLRWPSTGDLLAGLLRIPQAEALAEPLATAPPLGAEHGLERQPAEGLRAR